MIARNIAPWLDRDFSFEQFPCFWQEAYDKHLDEAEKKQYRKNYNISWSDIDNESLDIARDNAKHAWVDDTITFRYGDINQIDAPDPSTTVVCNPPYGKRMDPDNVSTIHHTLSQRRTRKTVIISG